MEFIDVSINQKSATVEETKFTHILKCGEFVKIAFKDKIKVSDYNKIVLTDYNDSGKAIFMAYYYARKDMFLGEKGEEFE